MIREALAAGAVTVEQASVIGKAVAALPSEAGAATVAEAAELLVSLAGRLEPTALRIAGERILLHVAPDLAEEADRRAAERDAGQAQQKRHLTWSIRTDEQLHLKGVLDPEAAAVLTAALSPLAKPAGVDDTRNPGQRRHDALAEVCRLALRTGELPESGSEPAQAAAPRAGPARRRVRLPRL